MDAANWQFSRSGWQPYGSRIRWFRNTLMDILVALFVAAAVVWHG